MNEDERTTAHNAAKKVDEIRIIADRQILATKALAGHSRFWFGTRLRLMLLSRLANDISHRLMKQMEKE